MMPLDRRLRDGMQRIAADLDPDVQGRLEATLRDGRRAGQRQQLRTVLALATVILAVIFVGPPLIDAFRNREQGVGASPSPTPTLSLSGTYGTTLVSTDVAVTSNRMPGDWTIQFGSSGILTVATPPGFTGTRSGYSFQVTAEQFRTDLFGADVCSTLLPGTYRWSLSSDRLTFTVVDDSCPGRVALLTSAAWNTDLLTGTWATGETTCAQSQAAVEAAGFTAEQMSFSGWSPTCGSQFTIRFADGRLVTFTDGEVGWDGLYRIVDDQTFEAGDLGTGYYITYQYAVDGDQLTIDMIENDYPATSEAELMGELLAQTEIYETSPFTRQD